MITIKKIAQLANVSAGTVDRIIHNRGQVTQENIDAVNKIIKEYGYKRNIFASNLAFNKKFNIAVFLPKREDLEYWKLPIIGVQKAAEEFSAYGMKVDYFYYKYDIQSFKKMAQKLLKLDYDGLLFAPIFNDESFIFLNQLKEKNIPVVMIDSKIDVDEKLDISFIGQDAIKSGLLAAKLISTGMKDGNSILIVKITREIESTSIYLQRIKGFYSFFKNNKDFSNVTFNEIKLKESGDIYLTKEIFQGVDAVFVPNSRAFIIAEFIKKNELKNIKIIGYDLLKQNVTYLNEGYIDFLINQKPEQQGYLAISTLYKKLVLKNEADKNNYIPLEIIVKENYYNQSC